MTLADVLANPSYPLESGLFLGLRNCALSDAADKTPLLAMADACDDDGLLELGYALRWAAKNNKRPEAPRGRASFLPGSPIVNRWRWFEMGVLYLDDSRKLMDPVYRTVRGMALYEWQRRNDHVAYMQAHQAWATLANALVWIRGLIPTPEELVKG